MTGRNTKTTEKIVDLHNFGYIENKIPKKLHNLLLSECDYAELKNPDMISGLTAKDVAKHKLLINTKEHLIKYIIKLMHSYNSYFPGLQKVRVLTKDLPFHFNTPWINFQRKGEYIPNHNHDGIYSYNLWLKIPTKCRFEFIYNNTIGNLCNHTIELTKKDEGKIIFFPAKLQHIAYPFNDSNDIRVSISGNIVLNANKI